MPYTPSGDPETDRLLQAFYELQEEQGSKESGNTPPTPYSPSQGALRALHNARQAIQLEEEVRQVGSLDRYEQLALVRQAMLLADSYDTFIALLRGESVSPSRLRPEWVRHFGRRRPT